MKTQSSWKAYAGFAVSLCLCATLELQAQQRPTTGFGSFGGTSSGGSSGMSRSGGSSGSSSSSQYNPNGGVGSATISMDSDTRSITVIADEETMKTVSQVISSLDKPRPQVLIKVVFLELTHTDDSDIGVEGGVKIGNSFVGANGFGLSALSAGVSSNNFLGQPLSSFQQITPYAVATPGAGLYQVLGKDFQATLRAIAQAGKATLLSRPSVLSRDGQPASVVVGQNVPLVTSVSYSTSGVTTFPIVGITYSSVGIILRVTPYITSSGMVQMMVSPTISSVDASQSQTIAVSPNGGSPVTAPYIDIRSADTVVMTPDAQTVVIGGMIRHDKSTTDIKIPVLGDIPWMGKLFKRTVKSNDKNELLIFLTPHIVQTPTQLAAMASKERTMMMPQKSESEEMLDRFLDKIPVKAQKPDGKNPPAKP